MDLSVSQNVLGLKFKELQNKNPRLTLRSFAKKLDVSPATLSGFLKGNRSISKTMAQKISDRLPFSPVEKRDFLWPFLDEAHKRSKEFEYTSINLNEYEVISKWYHFGILSLLNTKDFNSDHEWIAERLGISKTVVEKSIERLLELGLLVEDNGSYKRSQERFVTSDGIVNLSVQESHMNSLDLAKDSLMRHPIDVRDFRSLTMAVNPQKIPLARKLIRKFLSDLSAVMEDENQEEVYQICVQLFPLSTLKESNQTLKH